MLLAVVLAAATAGAKPADLSAVLKPVLAKGPAPGMVAAIVSSDTLVAIGAAGLRKRGGKDAVTIKDRFHIGSCTKAMTATMCAALVERGKLKWEDTLFEAFGLEHKDMHEGYRPVRLDQLLSHLGGMPNQLDPGLWSNLWRFKGTPTDARKLMLATLVKTPPAAKVGVQYVYSNAGFSVAGLVAESRLRISWRALMGVYVFEPLEMTSAGFGAPATVGLVDQPWGHNAAGIPVPPGPLADNPAAVGPAGRVHCTIADWGKFASLHLRGARGKSKVLTQKTFKKLHTPPVNNGSNYALGWMRLMRPWAGGPVLTHNGSNTMWFAVVWIAPNIDAAYLVACNQGGPGAAQLCDRAVGALIRWHLERKKAAKKAGS